MNHQHPARTAAFTRVRPFLIPCLLFAASQLPGQQTPPTKSDQAPSPATTTLSVDARLVNIPVVVRDKKGALVQNLTKNDFTLRVDDHPGTIRYFDLDANLPLTLGLLVDTSGSVRNVLDEERTASSAFLDKMLTAPANREPDKAFIIQFAYQVELLQDVTSSRPKLQAALRDIDTTGSYSNSQSDPNDPNNNGGGRRARGGGTALYDAAFLAADELMSKQKGRKALILLTDGVDNGSKESLTKAIEAAQRADTIIYAIYFKGEQGGGGYPGNRGGGYPAGRGGGYPGGGGGRFPGGGGGYPGGGGGYPGGGGGYPGGGGGGGQRGPGGGGQHADGKKTLDRMATETGGRLFEVTKKETFDQIYTEIAAELRGMYRLGYTPDPATASDGYHQIDLAFTDSDKQKNFKIQTRDGYYTGK